MALELGLRLMALELGLLDRALQVEACNTSVESAWFQCLKIQCEATARRNCFSFIIPRKHSPLHTHTHSSFLSNLHTLPHFTHLIRPLAQPQITQALAQK
jgi:hypothetical protein